MRLAATLLALAAFTLPAIAQNPPDSAVVGTKQFEQKVLTDGLEGPWEITWGPDEWLWVTERTGGKVTRVNPADGTKQVAIDIEEVSAPGGQDGLLGMALDPGLLQGSGNDYVYVSYTYVDKSLGGIPWVTDTTSPYHDLWVKIVRLTYDEPSGTLKDPVDLITAMPGKNDHNSGRLKFGPDSKLYYTIGDGGKDQLGNWCIPIEAQRLPTADEIAASDWMSYQGKTLRLNLDGSIPEDNPEIAGVRSHIMTYGHRNAQGIDFGPDGTLYASEQGPKTDDEINVLVSGGNYAWPHIAGFQDDMAYQYARWSDSTNPPCAELTFSDITIPPSVPVEDESSWKEPFVAPIATLFTVPSDWNFQDPACKGIDFICWPTVAASSMQAYFPEQGAGIPGWENSLLVTTLKRGSIFRIPLSADGQTVSGPIERYFQSENRLRDMALSPDMKTLYVATDVSGLVGTLDGGAGTKLENPGAILVYTYTGEGDGSAAATTTEAPAATTAEAAPAAEVTGDPPVFTAEQAARGKTAYDANCVSCHGPDLISANYGPPLAGPYFADSWGGNTVAALFEKVHTMPPSRPGELSEETYIDLVSYILQVNGVAPGNAELPTDTGQLDKMVIPKAQ